MAPSGPLLGDRHHQSETEYGLGLTDVVTGGVLNSDAKRHYFPFQSRILRNLQIALGTPLLAHSTKLAAPPFEDYPFDKGRYGRPRHCGWTCDRSVSSTRVPSGPGTD